MLDGLLDEAIWRAIKPASTFIQREPNDGAPATRPTEVRVLITDEAALPPDSGPGISN